MTRSSNSETGGWPSNASLSSFKLFKSPGFLSNRDFRDEVHGCALFCFVGGLLDPSSKSWTTLLGIAIVHCDEAVLLTNHELHLREEHSNFGTSLVAVI